MRRETMSTGRLSRRASGVTQQQPLSLRQRVTLLLLAGGLFFATKAIHDPLNEFYLEQQATDYLYNEKVVGHESGNGRAVTWYRFLVSYIKGGNAATQPTNIILHKQTLIDCISGGPGGWYDHLIRLTSLDGMWSYHTVLGLIVLCYYVYWDTRALVRYDIDNNTSQKYQMDPTACLHLVGHSFKIDTVALIWSTIRYSIAANILKHIPHPAKLAMVVERESRSVLSIWNIAMARTDALSESLLVQCIFTLMLYAMLLYIMYSHVYFRLLPLLLAQLVLTARILSSNLYSMLHDHRSRRLQNILLLVLVLMVGLLLVHTYVPPNWYCYIGPLSVLALLTFDPVTVL